MATSSFPNLFEFGTCVVTDGAFDAFLDHGLPPAAAFEAHGSLWPTPAMTPQQHQQRLLAVLSGYGHIVTHLILCASSPLVSPYDLTVVTDNARLATVLMLTREWSVQ